MTRDPFDQMLRTNPVPPDQASWAPMSEAARIVGSRISMPGWQAAVVAAAAAVAIGGGTLVLATQGRDVVVADSGAAAVEKLVQGTPPPTATSAPVVVSTPAPDDVTGTMQSPEDFECSGSRVTAALVDQSGLPGDVASLRAELFDAAVTCDWDRLRLLQVEGFAHGFDAGDDAISFWQQLESNGEEPIRLLAELLNRPFARQPGPASDYHVWPSAFATEWALVPGADREALRPLYDEEDFRAFADSGGYFGYRVGILDGTWMYFLVGD